VVPALRKLREERGTRFVGTAKEQRPGHPRLFFARYPSLSKQGSGASFYVVPLRSRLLCNFGAGLEALCIFRVF
jgi:hypothetical protein